MIDQSSMSVLQQKLCWLFLQLKQRMDPVSLSVTINSCHMAYETLKVVEYKEETICNYNCNVINEHFHSA
jgi:hypothetical protein